MSKQNDPSGVFLILKITVTLKNFFVPATNKNMVTFMNNQKKIETKNSFELNMKKQFCLILC